MGRHIHIYSKLFYTFIFCAFINSFAFNQECLGSIVAPTEINGVRITSDQTGSVNKYTSKYTSCANVVTPENSLWMGSGGDFTYTLRFSKPVNEIRMMITATGNYIDEVFNIHTNQGNPKIEIINSCNTKVEGNQIISGAKSESAGGGGAFLIKTQTAFTSFTISGKGGENGSIFSFCTDFKFENSPCSVSNQLPKLNKKELLSSCTNPYVDLSAIKEISNTNLQLTWHKDVKPSAKNQIKNLRQLDGRYYAAFYDPKNDCFSAKSVPVEIIDVAKIKVNAGADVEIFEGDSLKLHATGSKSYVWDKNVTQDKFFKPVLSQSYEVTGINSYGCTSRDAVFVKLGKVPFKSAKEVPLENFDIEYFRPINVVFVLDISTSMNTGNKFNLLKSSMESFLSLLRPQDVVSMVSYSNEANLILEATSGNNKQLILDKLNDLKTVGSTAGLEGMKMGFKQAQNNFSYEAYNMVIVITDGAFKNDNKKFYKTIEKYNRQDIHYSVVGIKNAPSDEIHMKEAAFRGNGKYIPIFKTNDNYNLLLEIKEFSFKKP